jgi:hypothetical protein
MVSMMATAFLISAVLFAFAYPLLQRWLLLRTSADRDRFVDLGRDMLASPAYNEQQKYFISDMLDDAMDWRFMMLAVWYLPRLALKGILAKHEVEDKDLDDLFRDKQFCEFIRLHQKAVMAANPLLALLFRVEVALLVMVLGLVGVSFLVLRTIEKVTSRVHGSDPCPQ